MNVGGNGTLRVHGLIGNRLVGFEDGLQIDATKVKNNGGLSLGNSARLTTQTFESASGVQTVLGGTSSLIADSIVSRGQMGAQGNVAQGLGPRITADSLFTSDRLYADSGAVITVGRLEVAPSGEVHIGRQSGQGGGTVRVTERLILNGALRIGSFMSNPGEFVMDPGAVLSGSGTILSLDPWLLGAVAPGNSIGTLTFQSGTTTNAATNLQIELAPAANPVAGTDNDLIAVTGTATINGGTVTAQRLGAGAFVKGAEYMFLTADDLVVNQAFNVVSDVVGVGFTGQFTAGPGGTYRLLTADIVTPLQVAGSAAAPRFSTFNRRAAAGALTGLGSGPPVAAFNAAPTDAARRTLLDDLSGELYPTFLTAQAQDAARFFDLVSAQSFGPPWSCAACGTPRAGLSGWMSGYGAGRRVNADGNARAAEAGVGGTAVGLTRCFAGGLSAGAFYGFENSTVRVPDAASSVTADVHRVGGWGRADAGRLYGRAAAQVGFADAESRRGFPRGGAPVAGGFDGVTSAAEVEAGVRLGGPAGYLAPAAGLRFLHVDQDGFSETGGPAALAVDDSSLSALRARVGAHAGAALPGGGPVPVAGTLAAFYERDLNASAVGETTAAFAGSSGTGGGPAFAARGTDFARDRVTLGPGVALGGGPVKVIADYRAGLTESGVEHAGGARLEVCF